VRSRIGFGGHWHSVASDHPTNYNVCLPDERAPWEHYRRANMSNRRIHRRAFLRRGSLVLAGAAIGAQSVSAADSKPNLRLGLVADLHYADREPAGTRHHRETIPKFREAARCFQQEKVDAVIELGDIIDAADSVDAERGYLKRVVQEFTAVPGKHHYVLGNHCVWSLTKAEFLEVIGHKESYYSFDLGGHHFVVLDACFRKDGEPYGRKNNEWTDANIPAAEVEWLRADLQRTDKKTVVFVHQCLDVAPPYGIQNATEVRKALEQSGKVLAVFQGHYHKGGYRRIGGIHYCTLAAMIESKETNAYSIMEVLPGGKIRIQGSGRQAGYDWITSAPAEQSRHPRRT
jgi:alkaline phosphatase